MIENKKLLRLCDIIGDKRKGITAIIPVSRYSWYRGIKNGIFPEPVKLGARTSVWRTEDIIKCIDQLK
jgi:predicted DNA-binding transcriptional regulator AlpA